MILVTGATGFLGRHLFAELLRQEVGARALVRDLAKYQKLFPQTPAPIVADLAQFTLNKIELPVENLIHLGSDVWPVSRKDGADFERTNVQGTQKLLEALDVTRLRRIVLSSSYSIYGPVKGDVTEAHPLNTSNSYSISKIEQEKVVQNFAAKNKVSATILRFSSIYGKGQHEETVLPTFLRAAREGQDLKVQGAKGRTQNFLFVRDAVESILCSLNSPASGVFNIGGERETSMKELAELIVKQAHSRSKVLLQESNETASPFHLDSSKAARELNWRPRFSIESGLRELNV